MSLQQRAPAGDLRIGGLTVPVSGRLPMGCAGAFAVPFVLVGALLAFFAYGASQVGDLEGTIGLTVVACLVGGFGLAPLYVVMRARDRAARREAVADEPWRVREEWDSNVVVAGVRDKTRRMGVFGVVWNLITWPTAVNLTLVQEPAGAAVWIVWLFPLAGLAFMAPALYDWLRRRKFGQATFVMDTFPGVVGGQLRGAIRADLADRSLPDEPVNVRLGCYERSVRRRTDSDGDTHRNVVYDEIWSDEQEVTAREDDAGVLTVPVDIDVPPGLDPATIEKRQNRIVWRLDVEAESTGIDFGASFEIPIFDSTYVDASRAGATSDGSTADTEDGLRAAVPDLAAADGAATVHEHGRAEATDQSEPGLTSQYGREPWRHRDTWTSNRIEAERDKESYGIIIFSLVWLALTAGGAYLYATGAGEGGSVGLFVAFGAMGLGVLAIGVWRLLKQRKYRHVVLELDEMPGVIGGTIAGRVETDMDPAQEPKDGFHVMLTCYRRRLRRDSDGDRTVSYEPLWRDESRMRGRPYGDGGHVEVPFFFEVPPDQPESTPTAKPNRVAWRVEVGADVPGIDFDAAIEVPVFVVEGRSRAEGASDEAVEERRKSVFWDLGDDEASATLSRAEDDDGESNVYSEDEIRRTLTEPVSTGITMTTRPDGGVRFEFGAARNKGTATLLTAIFLFSAVFLVGSVMGGFQPMLFLILLFFASATGYGAWSYWTHASSIVVERGRVVVESGSFGRGKKDVLPCAALGEIDIATRSDGKYDLRLVRADLDDAQLAAIRDRSVEKAQKLEGWLRTAGLMGRRRGSDGTLEENLARHGALGDAVKVAYALSDRQEAEWIASRIEEVARSQRVVEWAM